MIKKLIYLLLLLTVFDVAYCQDLDEEIDYDICVTKKGMYIRKKMENEILIVYEI